MKGDEENKKIDWGQATVDALNKVDHGKPIYPGRDYNKEWQDFLARCDAKNEKIDWGQASVDGLNKTVGESVARGERWEKIFAIERTKWPDNMDDKSRDKYIGKSHDIARDACQTPELTEAYLRKNSKKISWWGKIMNWRK